MKIEFYQSGGITGLHLSCEVDTRALPKAEAAEIESLVRKCGVLNHKRISLLGSLMPRFRLPTGVACDILGYSITVHNNEVNYHVSFDDLTIPEGGRPLLNYLKKHARPRRL
jgi:hypothetical protein